MQTANCLVSLAGDTGMQVPKSDVTASEIAVLQAIHGAGSVTDIEPSGEIERSDREERSRLQTIYGRPRDGRDTSPVAMLFPGVAARLFQTLSELDLPEEQYKAKTRVSADDKPVHAASAPKVAPAPKPVAAKPEKPLTAAQKRHAERAAARAEKAQAAPATPPAAEPPDDNDGIGDMPDKGAFG